jgi:hypothetical protein
MMRAVIANLPEKTGKSLEQWLAILRKDGPPAAKEQVKWLKAVHNVGHVTAQCIVASAQGKGDEYETTDKLVDNLFGEGNPVFKAIYEKVLAEIKALPDTQAKPCKTYVPFFHRVQFARIKPAGESHVELFLALGDAEPGKGRLTPVKSREARMSHVIALHAPEDVNTEVRKWLKKAYSEAA